MDEYWFRPKTRGYGCTPIHWKGWLFVIVFVVAVGAGTLLIEGSAGYDMLSPGWAVAYYAALTGVFLVVARKKTNGPWRWR